MILPSICNTEENRTAWFVITPTQWNDGSRGQSAGSAIEPRSRQGSRQGSCSWTQQWRRSGNNIHINIRLIKCKIGVDERESSFWHGQNRMGRIDPLNCQPPRLRNNGANTSRHLNLASSDRALFLFCTCFSYSRWQFIRRSAVNSGGGGRRMRSDTPPELFTPPPATGHLVRQFWNEKGKIKRKRKKEMKSKSSWGFRNALLYLRVNNWWCNSQCTILTWLVTKPQQSRYYDFEQLQYVACGTINTFVYLCILNTISL